jgi:hypothetical protein
VPCVVSQDVLNPALADDDIDEAVYVTLAEFDRHHPDVVVASSWGRAAVMGRMPLLLLCPPWKRWGMATT